MKGEREAKKGRQQHAPVPADSSRLDMGRARGNKFFSYDAAKGRLLMLDPLGPCCCSLFNSGARICKSSHVMYLALAEQEPLV